MNTNRPPGETMSLEETTISNMWEIAEIEDVLERKDLCTKQDRYDIVTEFRRTNPRTKAEVGVNTMAMARPIPEESCLTN